MGEGGAAALQAAGSSDSFFFISTYWMTFSKSPDFIPLPFSVLFRTTPGNTLSTVKPTNGRSVIYGDALGLIILV